ncbi:Uncharacterized protein TCM_038917 [Theobroma cacao]|uniref:Uncharacterized protein n=1 Tax=Theobroma cacao TaxID=3641 RepID=A0A061GXG2_THECC|nr:Uncharacterized protein TCM_038917 [Theobroma cacao]
MEILATASFTFPNSLNLPSPSVADKQRLVAASSSYLGSPCFAERRVLLLPISERRVKLLGFPKSPLLCREHRVVAASLSYMGSPCFAERRVLLLPISEHRVKLPGFPKSPLLCREQKVVAGNLCRLLSFSKSLYFAFTSCAES